MSFVPIRLVKRENGRGITKVQVFIDHDHSACDICRFNERWGYDNRPQSHESPIFSVVPDLIPQIHAALTKYLAEENANRN